MPAESAGMLLGPPPPTVTIFCANAGPAKSIAKHTKYNALNLRMILNMIRSLHSQEWIGLFAELLTELFSPTVGPGFGSHVWPNVARRDFNGAPHLVPRS